VDYLDKFELELDLLIEKEIQVYITKGSKCIENEDYDEALDIYDEGLDLWEEYGMSSKLFLKKAECYLFMDDLEQALEFFDKWMASDHSVKYDAFIFLSKYFDAQGEDEQRFKQLSNARSYDPDRWKKENEDLHDDYEDLKLEFDQDHLVSDIEGIKISKDKE